MLATIRGLRMAVHKKLMNETLVPREVQAGRPKNERDHVFSTSRSPVFYNLPGEGLGPGLRGPDTTFACKDNMADGSRSSRSNEIELSKGLHV